MVSIISLRESLSRSRSLTTTNSVEAIPPPKTERKETKLKDKIYDAEIETANYHQVYGEACLCSIQLVLVAFHSKLV